MKAAYHPPDHFVQESGAGKIETVQRSEGMQLRLPDGAGLQTGGIFSACKTAEYMLTLKGVQGAL